VGDMGDMSLKQNQEAFFSGRYGGRYDLKMGDMGDILFIT